MTVPVVQVRVVQVLVTERLVPMPMRMGFGNVALVDVAVVFIVHMAVVMLCRIMLVCMVMPFGKMQPKPERHKRPRNGQSQCWRFAKDRNCQYRADKRRKRVICAGSGGTQMAKCQDKHYQTDTYAKEADSRSGKCMASRWPAHSGHSATKSARELLSISPAETASGHPIAGLTP